ncbi:MAG: nucleotidyltransferase domain-containing protein [Deltaproteobacteria bacterium]
MDKNIQNTISTLKSKYEPEGFIILGVFGSVARGDDHKDSDIDILYRCDSGSSKKHSGLRFFALYEQVKTDLENLLGRRVDLADINGLNEIGKKYILPEVRYVL